MNSIAQIAKYIEQQRDWMAAFGKAVQTMLDSMEVDAKKIGPILSSANLWIPPSSMKKDLVGSLVELIAKGKTESEQVELAFVAYYEEKDWAELKQVVSSWQSNPYFADRMFIIWDALDAHINSKYILSIPTLLCQIEGIASHIVGKTPGSPQKVIPNLIDNESPEFMSSASKDILIYYVTNITYPGWINFDKFVEWLKTNRLTENQALQRHAILHGVQVNYASKTNSLRAFLILDSLYWLKRKEWDEKLKFVLKRASRK